MLNLKTISLIALELAFSFSSASTPEVTFENEIIKFHYVIDDYNLTHNGNGDDVKTLISIPDFFETSFAGKPTLPFRTKTLFGQRD